MELEEIAKQAARQGQAQILEWCFAYGWYYPAESFSGKFLLAAMDGASPAVFQVLIDHGWNINGHYSENCGDILTSAICGGEHDFAKWLLEHGHDPTPKEGIHEPYAIVETVHGDMASIDVLKLLLEYGINVERTGVGVAAADEGNVEGLGLLLDHGVLLEDRDMCWYPFDDDRDEPYESQGTALYRACRQGHAECVVLLLARGADAQAKDDGGISCLGIAKKRKHQDVVRPSTLLLGVLSSPTLPAPINPGRHHCFFASLGYGHRVSPWRLVSVWGIQAYRHTGVTLPIRTANSSNSFTYDHKILRTSLLVPSVKPTDK
jgi:hypothetical protein